MSNERKIVCSILSCLNAISLFVIILFTSVQLTAFNSNFFKSEYEKYSVDTETQIEIPELMKLTEHMLNYLKGKNDNLNIKVKIGDECRFFFNDKELFHMKDVKDLFIGGYKIRNMSCVLFLLTAAILIMLKNNSERLKKAYRITFIAGISLFIAVGTLIFTDFTKYFILFHKVFFSNDLWTLDPGTDLLINIVPEGFFIDTVTQIVFTFLVAVAVVLVFSFNKTKR